MFVVVIWGVSPCLKVWDAQIYACAAVSYLMHRASECLYMVHFAGGGVTSGYFHRWAAHSTLDFEGMGWRIFLQSCLLDAAGWACDAKFFSLCDENCVCAGGQTPPSSRAVKPMSDGGIYWSGRPLWVVDGDVHCCCADVGGCCIARVQMKQGVW